MIKGEGKGISLLNARFFRTVNNALPGDIFPSFPIRPILPFFRD